MVRTVIIPTGTDIHISIAKEYVGKPLEITYLSLDELKSLPEEKTTMADLWNTISDETATKLHENVLKLRNEWEQDT